jgi:hypothetical protein
VEKKIRPPHSANHLLALLLMPAKIFPADDDSDKAVTGGRASPSLCPTFVFPDECLLFKMKWTSCYISPSLLGLKTIGFSSSATSMT